jgi:hypothetical protein
VKRCVASVHKKPGRVDEFLFVGIRDLARLFTDAEVVLGVVRIAWSASALPPRMGSAREAIEVSVRQW